MDNSIYCYKCLNLLLQSSIQFSKDICLSFKASPNGPHPYPMSIIIPSHHRPLVAFRDKGLLHFSSHPHQNHPSAVLHLPPLNVSSPSVKRVARRPWISEIVIASSTRLMPKTSSYNPASYDPIHESDSPRLKAASRDVTRQGWTTD